MKSVLFALCVTLLATAVPRAQDKAAPADVVGTWDITTTSPISETTSTAVISKDGDKLKAVVKGDGGELPYDKVSQAGSDVTLVLTIDYQGSPMTITYNGTVDGGRISGSCDFGGLAQGTWSAVKK